MVTKCFVTSGYFALSVPGSERVDPRHVQVRRDKFCSEKER